MAGRARTLVFVLIMVAVVVAAVEILAHLTHAIVFREFYAFGVKAPALEREQQTANRLDEFLRNEIIHPYLGFVVDRGSAAENQRTYGFNSAHSPLASKNPNTLTVAILGGSVAEMVAPHVEKAFQRQVRLTPMVVCLALGGYKQPQQLLALSYFLALGARYDIVVNLDGFNEVALSESENYRSGVNPFFPRYWNLRITRQPGKAVLSQIGKVRYLRDWQEKIHEDLATGWLRNSAAYGLAKKLVLSRVNREIRRSSLALFRMQESMGKKFEESGPVLTYPEADGIFQDAASVWVNCSLLMHNLTRSTGGNIITSSSPINIIRPQRN